MEAGGSEPPRPAPPLMGRPVGGWGVRTPSPSAAPDLRIQYVGLHIYMYLKISSDVAQWRSQRGAPSETPSQFLQTMNPVQLPEKCFHCFRPSLGLRANMLGRFWPINSGGGITMQVHFIRFRKPKNTNSENCGLGFGHRAKLGNNIP